MPPLFLPFSKFKRKYIVRIPSLPMENQGPPTPHPGSAATIDRKIERLLNVNSSSSQYIHDIECFFEFCGKLLARENETKHSSKHLDYAKSLLVAQIEKTSARREHTTRGLAAAEDTMKSLEALRLRAAGNFCAKKLKRELGDAKYNYLANEWLLAEITNQRASAGNNMQLWLRKKEKATAKIEELGYSNHELGTLVMAIVNGQVYDECSSKDLFTMERKNRKMVIRWQLMGHKARGVIL